MKIQLIHSIGLSVICFTLISCGKGVSNQNTNNSTNAEPSQAASTSISSGQNSTSKDVSVSAISPNLFKFCGKIYRYQPFGLASSDNNVLLQNANGLEYVLITNIAEVQAVLDSIQSPSDEFSGCVYSNEPSKQGFEGNLINVLKIES